MPRSLADRIYLHERICDFFLEHLAHTAISVPSADDV
jgi:hypothetical protein